MLIINGNNVRITGLRMQGPGGVNQFPYANGIATQDQFTVLIDHNEMVGWTAAAVCVSSEGIRDHRDPYSRPQNLRVVRNFIHHGNTNGYGVVTYGGYPSIAGNTFNYNRHSIAASNELDTSYRAWFNLALSGVPPTLTPDFDAHGTGDHGFGGTAGQYFEIARNTFLGTNRENFILRGTPAYLADFHDNISRLSQGDALKNLASPEKLVVRDNKFSAPNPTNRLGVGDFDGNGADDLLLATGTAWYYSPSGKVEWRFLSTKTETSDQFLLGDFDSDARTDIVTINAERQLVVSWGGISNWELLNQYVLIDTPRPLTDWVAVGDFDADLHADIFIGDTKTW